MPFQSEYFSHDSLSPISNKILRTSAVMQPDVCTFVDMAKVGVVGFFSFISVLAAFTESCFPRRFDVKFFSQRSRTILILCFKCVYPFMIDSVSSYLYRSDIRPLAAVRARLLCPSRYAHVLEKQKQVSRRISRGVCAREKELNEYGVPKSQILLRSATCWWIAGNC